MDAISQVKKLFNENNLLEAKNIIDENNLFKSDDIDLLIMIGDINLNLYFLEDAYNAYLKAIKLDKSPIKNLSPYVGIAKIYMKRKQYDNAENILKKAISHDVLDFECNTLLYEVQKIKELDKTTLLAQLEKINEIKETKEYSFEFAHQLYNNGFYKKCIKECNKILRKYRSIDIVQNTRELYLKAKEEMSKKEKQQTNQKSTNNKSKDENYPDELSSLQDFVGLYEVKKQIINFVNQMKFNKKRQQKFGYENSQNKGYHFVITGNPGTGKTTVARALAEILANIGIIKSNKLVEVDRSTLVSVYIGDTERNTKEKIKESYGGVLFIDEAYALYKPESRKDFGIDAINTLMKEMEDNRGTFTVIMAGYKKEMETFLESNPGLKSRIDYFIHIPDYTDEELVEIAERMAHKQNYMLSKEAKKALIERINRERIDENFGNARVVRKLIDEAIQRLASRLADKKFDKKEASILMPIDFGIEDIKPKEEKIKENLDKLHNLIGLSEVKEQVDTMINSVIVDMKRKEMGLEVSNKSLHMLFLGNPGTGKTTVARIIGEIYKALGILKRGDVFIECTRDDLISNHIGETAIKTKKIIKKAYGGILFIDEAYTLYQGDNDTFGKEAIGTLIKEMEDKRDNLMVILAGYPHEMENLLNANPGFKSRIGTTIHFYDYNAYELFEIFKSMCKSKYIVEEDALEKAFNHIKEIYENRDKNFGNGREIRNILEKIEKAQSNRIAKEIASGKEVSREDLMTIKAEDIKL